MFNKQDFFKHWNIISNIYFNSKILGERRLPNKLEGLEEHNLQDHNYHLKIPWTLLHIFFLVLWGISSFKNLFSIFLL